MPFPCTKFYKFLENFYGDKIYIQEQKGGKKMYIKTIINQNKKPFYLLMNDDGTKVEEVYRYILHLGRTGKSKNTLKNNAYNLKLYYDWLSIMDLNYLDILRGKKDGSLKSTLEYLTDFLMWLKYGEMFNQKVVSIDSRRKPIKAKRKNRTLNQIMSSIYGFYDFLSFTEKFPELEIYKTIRNNTQSHNVLSEMFLYRENIRSSVLKQRPEKQKIKYITREQFWSVYKACSCRRDRIICGLLFDGALRVSEVCGLHIEDMADIFENKIHIVKRDDPDNPDAAVKYDSTGSVFIPDYLKNEIILYLNEISNVDTNYFVFTMYGDNKYSAMRTSTIRDMIQRVGKKCGIKSLHPHQFRHGMAVEMANKIATESHNPDSAFYGLQMVDVKEKLRHSTMQATEIYADVDLESKRKAAEEYYKQINKDYTNDESLDDIAKKIL